jgi:hypothetical protein
MKNNFKDFNDLKAFGEHPVSGEIDAAFKSVMKKDESISKKVQASPSSASGVSMGHNEQDLEIEEIEIDLGGDEPPAQDSPLDEGLDLSFSEDENLDLVAPDFPSEGTSVTEYGDLSLDDDSDELSLDDDDDFSLDDDDNQELSLSEDDTGSEEASDDLRDLDFSEAPEFTEDKLSLSELSLSKKNAEESLDLDLSLGEGSTRISNDLPLSFGEEEELSLDDGATNLSQDALKKLKEIDAIMDLDASQINLSSEGLSKDENLDHPLVSDDLDLASLDFSAEEAADEMKEEKSKKKKKEAQETPRDHDYGQELKEISGAYSGEMERMQATISNLRADREELLAKIQKFEDDKVLGGRQSLSLRAELDEKKIELTIIRKKLNEEVNDLKDRLKFFDEKRLILEEKNRILTQELDKSAQRNKMDVKKVQMRERELEQKLELLKSDAEAQIRHRDLKILELKRKIDAMEFDMESISSQEKRSVESRFELEDKLEKAIKTLRGAITVLEDESDRTNALDALKKNIDM